MSSGMGCNSSSLLVTDRRLVVLLSDGLDLDDAGGMGASGGSMEGKGRMRPSSSSSSSHPTLGSWRGGD